MHHLILAYKDWDAELGTLSQIAGSLAGFVLLFATVAFQSDRFTGRRLANFTKLVGVTLWCSLGAAYLLGHATAFSPAPYAWPPIHPPQSFGALGAVDGYYHITHSRSFAAQEFIGDCGCMLFSTTLSLVILCLSLFLYSHHDEKEKAIVSDIGRYATVLTLATVLVVTFELSQLVIFAIGFLNDHADPEFVTVTPPWPLEEKTFIAAMAPAILVLIIRCSISWCPWTREQLIKHSNSCYGKAGTISCVWYGYLSYLLLAYALAMICIPTYYLIFGRSAEFLIYLALKITSSINGFLVFVGLKNGSPKSTPFRPRISADHCRCSRRLFLPRRNKDRPHS